MSSSPGDVDSGDELSLSVEPGPPTQPRARYLDPRYLAPDQPARYLAPASPDQGPRYQVPDQAARYQVADPGARYQGGPTSPPHSRSRDRVVIGGYSYETPL